MARAYEEKDLGYLRILRELDELGRKEILVGLQDDGATSKDGVNVAEYGTYNEYGTRTIPERSFMRSTFDNTVDKLNRTKDKLLTLVTMGKLDAETAANLLGEMHEGDIKKTIGRGVPPPNAPSTVRRKGSSKTLIDDGIMRNSIRYKVKTSTGSRLGRLINKVRFAARGAKI